MSLQQDLNQLTEKTNQLLNFAINHCQLGDRFNLWYSWPLRENQVELRLWWKFYAGNDNTDWDLEVDYYYIEKSRIKRIETLERYLIPEFKLFATRLDFSLTCGNLCIK